MWRQGLVLAFVVISVTARAEQPGGWQAPPGCPDPASSRSLVREHPAAVEALWDGLADVRIGRAPSGELRARVTLRLTDTVEVRVLHGVDCQSLGEAALLVVDLAAEGAARLGAQPAPENAAPPREPPTEPPLVAPAEGVPAPSAPPTGPAAEDSPRALRPRTGLGAVAYVGVDVGSLPGPTAALALGGALSRGSFRVDLAGSYLVARSLVVDGQGHAGAELDLFTVGARGCYLPSLRPGRSPKWRLGPCGGVEVGAQRGRGVGLRGAREGRGPWSAAWLGAMLSVGPFGHLQPFVRLDLGRVIASPAFEISGATAHHAQGWLFDAGAGLSWWFGEGPG